MKRVLLLVAVGVGLWLVLLGPAWWWYGEPALLHSGVALALSLVPAVATMLWATGNNAPERQLLAALGGSVVRMGVALGVGAFLFFEYPQTFSAAFLGWVLVFYLVLLALEVTLLLRPAGPPPSDHTRSSI
jgi:hypothetical protein